MIASGRCPHFLAIGFFLFAGTPAIPQVSIDKDTYGRAYVLFQVEQADQWTRGFSQAFSQALVTLPASLPESDKSSAENLRASIQALVARGGSANVLTDGEFRKELQQALSHGSAVNQVFGAHKVAEGLRAEWVHIRLTLNNLARIYRLESLEPLGPPASTPKSMLASAPPPEGKGIVGYFVDQQCAKRGKAMWTNVTCIQRCIREGDKIVIVTEEGKVYQVANPEKIEADSYGQKVTIFGDIAGETVTVSGLR